MKWLNLTLGFNFDQFVNGDEDIIAKQMKNSIENTIKKCTRWVLHMTAASARKEKKIIEADEKLLPHDAL